MVQINDKYSSLRNTSNQTVGGPCKIFAKEHMTLSVTTRKKSHGHKVIYPIRGLELGLFVVVALRGFLVFIFFVVHGKRHRCNRRTPSCPRNDVARVHADQIVLVQRDVVVVMIVIVIIVVVVVISLLLLLLSRGRVILVVVVLLIAVVVIAFLRVLVATFVLAFFNIFIVVVVGFFVVTSALLRLGLAINSWLAFFGSGKRRLLLD
ncbi:hypothetical protein H257_05078 [Aphanomyces astaci]|uniref:Uncharacterized protein n=1 Tax=Aphanomyces astaci TaxID=112090 RepID=W4GRT1_APHAT|nr:hypothetical protein H257_05078 [Aphanomyces astaci]ETV82440.1 hypothetical protein H257_05078 [Aphanomyces astaci]|eukprot:XP_009828109.1 hypothetical protein H257_05078 [Aphanomyces astaci]